MRGMFKIQWIIITCGLEALSLPYHKTYVTLLTRTTSRVHLTLNSSLLPPQQLSHLIFSYLLIFPMNNNRISLLKTPRIDSKSIKSHPNLNLIVSTIQQTLTFI